MHGLARNNPNGSLIGGLTGYGNDRNAPLLAGGDAGSEESELDQVHTDTER